MSEIHARFAANVARLRHPMQCRQMRWFRPNRRWAPSEGTGDVDHWRVVGASDEQGTPRQAEVPARRRRNRPPSRSFPGLQNLIVQTEGHPPRFPNFSRSPAAPERLPRGDWPLRCRCRWPHLHAIVTDGCFLPDGSAKVVYKSKDGRTEQNLRRPRMARASRRFIFPNKYEQLVRYLNFFIKQVERHEKKKRKNRRHNTVDRTRRIDAENSFRRRWARLIQKIYEVDPLRCSRLSKSNEDSGDSRSRADRQKNLGTPRSLGCPATTTGPSEKESHMPETRLRTIRNIKSRNTTIGD